MKPLAPEAARAQGMAPLLSVVIASVNGWDVLERTLDALDAQPVRDRIEVIVVDAVGGETRKRLLARRPGVELIEADDAIRPGIPILRFRGVMHSRGNIVAMLEDHGEVGPQWAEALLVAHRDEELGAVGGAVENGRPGLINWAAFFCEYTPYMSPVTEGDHFDLPGNNVAYKRPHLLRHVGELERGRWESWINHRLRADGVRIASTNGAVVRHIKGFRLGHFIVQRFHFARSFAGMRRVDQSVAMRFIYGVGSLALPLLLMARVTRTAMTKRKNLAQFAAALPLLALFFAVGAYGEMLGYLIGPGSSLGRVE